MMHRLFIGSAGIALVVALSSPATAEDPLDRRLRALGPDAHDCGRTGPGEPNRGEVLGCVKSQVAAGTSFRARFDGSCADSICSWGLVREKNEGPIRLVPYDPKLCPPAVANDTDPWCGTLGAVPCRDPKPIVQGKSLRVVCEDYEF